MTLEHIEFERLSEFVDRRLSATDVAEIERHLALCASCRANLAGLRALLERAATLPRRIEPTAESWTVVRSRLAAPSRSSALRPRPWMPRWGLWAAAAIVLVAGSSALTVVAMKSKWFASPGRDARSAIAVATVPASVRVVDDSYAAVLDELTATLRAQRGSLAPETIATLERTLRIIDEAIAEARAALAADPGNDALLDVLAANYEHKVELLRRASELRART